MTARIATATAPLGDRSRPATSGCEVLWPTGGPFLGLLDRGARIFGEPLAFDLVFGGRRPLLRGGRATLGRGDDALDLGRDPRGDALDFGRRPLLRGGRATFGLGAWTGPDSATAKVRRSASVSTLSQNWSTRLGRAGELAGLLPSAALALDTRFGRAFGRDLGLSSPVGFALAAEAGREADLDTDRRPGRAGRSATGGFCAGERVASAPSRLNRDGRFGRGTTFATRSDEGRRAAGRVLGSGPLPMPGTGLDPRYLGRLGSRRRAAAAGGFGSWLTSSSDAPPRSIVVVVKASVVLAATAKLRPRVIAVESYMSYVRVGFRVTVARPGDRCRPKQGEIKEGKTRVQRGNWCYHHITRK